MRIIISGGSGLIGSELAKELLENGHELVILSRNPGRVTNLPNRLQMIGWDGKTSQGWGHLVEGAEAIINLAGENIAGEKFFPVRWTVERKRVILQSRLDAGKALIEAIRATESKPGLLVQSSAIGYYGPLHDETVDENWPAGRDFLAKTCQAWEDSTAEVESLGVRRAIIRTGVVLSSQGGAFARLLLPFKLFAGGPLGSGKQYLSWIHMADQVGAIRFLIENPVAQGVYNLTAPQPVNNAVLARIIGQVMGRPSFIPVPAFVFRMLFGEVATVVVDGQRVLPNRLQQLGYSFQFKQAEEAVRNLLGK
jgi:hypothetical protein